MNLLRVVFFSYCLFITAPPFGGWKAFGLGEVFQKVCLFQYKGKIRAMVASHGFTTEGALFYCLERLDKDFEGLKDENYNRINFLPEVDDWYFEFTLGGGFCKQLGPVDKAGGERLGRRMTLLFCGSGDSAIQARDDLLKKMQKCVRVQNLKGSDYSLPEEVTSL